ncbi:MAG: FAD/NAD(P)-binding oxidoreductase, partial [Solirubrobacteraceae bacterium]
RLINVAAIRSTGLSASLGIAEHVCGLVRDAGVELGEERELPPVAPPPAGRRPWWQRAAERSRA